MSEQMETKMPAKVLFVDDEENILNAIKRLMMDQEFETLTANSGEKGLALLKDNQEVALIVSDQRMPGLSGTEFLEQSREIAPDALRVMLTGYADIKATIDVINRGGAYRYLSKPWQDEELIQVIKDGVRQHSLIIENKRQNAVIQHKNEEIEEWNAGLKSRVLQLTATLRIRNVELRDKNTRLWDDFLCLVESFSTLVELRDHTTKQHAVHVAALSAKLAKLMKLNEKEMERIRIAALLHDIGKAIVPDTLFYKKTEEMDNEELKAYRLHPNKGQQVVDGIEELREAGGMILHHHESYDGSGFPDGLRGHDIPIGARIIAVADFVDRVIVRSPPEDALVQVRKQLETAIDRFDPAVCALVEKVLSDVA